MENLILNLLALPLIGSALIIIIPRKYTNEIKIIGLINSILTFNWSMLLLLFFDSNTANFQFVTELKWSISKRIIEIEFGIDGISLFFILLSTFLIPICIMVSWDYIQIYQKEFIITLLIIETLLIGVFTTLDLLGFYIFFESILMPMFFIIGIWGARERRILAAFQFFLYTLIGSFLMLLAILIIARTTGTTNIPELINNYEFSDQIQSILWLCFFLSFAVKVPMIPFHLWLPEAHVEAPTAGSVLLAGILLKLGSYGFLRISLPLFPNATELFSKGAMTLAIIGIIYSSLTTIRQNDLKKIIAYSSIGHMNLIMLGLFSANQQAIEGGILQMISHGIVSSALFICVGVLYDRYKTRIVKYYRGITITMPIFSILFFIFTMANISVPGTSSFAGEIMILISLYGSAGSIITILAATSIILGACYSVWLVTRLLFGNLTIYIYNFNEINYRESIILIPFLFLAIYLGIYPNIILDYLHVSVTNLITK